MLGIGLGISRSAKVRAAFTPASIPGLKLWLDASQLTGLNDGDVVGTFTDFGGGAHHATQSTAGNKPVFKTGQSNGLPSVRFDGVDDWMSNATLTVAQPNTIFLVVRQTGGSAAFRVSTDGVDATHREAFVYVVGSSKWSIYAGTGFVNQSSTTTSEIRVLTGIFNGASSAIRVNGGASSTGNAGSQGLSGGYYLGQDYNHNNGGMVGGDFFEYIVYDTVLNGTNLSLVENYLLTKYALP